MAKKVVVSDLLRHESGNMFLAFTFPMMGRGKGELIVPRGSATEPRRIFSELLNKGAKLRREDGLEEVKTAIDGAPTKPTGTLVTRHGWQNGFFASRKGIYGPCDGTVFYRPLIEDDPAISAVAGSLEAWREGMRDPLAASSYLTFTLSLAFGAPLAEPLGVEGGVSNLQGKTSSGKSLTARGGQSVSGRAQLNDLVSLALTTRALEELCASRSNGLVVIDETARLDKGFSKKDFEALVYGVASGRGKMRSSIVSKNGPLANVIWHVLALLTSEVSFNPRSLKGGAGLRYAEIPVPSPKFGGVFDRTGLTGEARLQRASQLAAQLEGCISANYGVAFPPYISAVAEDRQTFIKRGKSLVEEFVETVGAKGDPQKERLARKFGVAFAGGVIAAELGILPCDSKHISRSISRLYKKAERVLGGPRGRVLRS
jgi:putative DNA primase/helicase